MSITHKNLQWYKQKDMSEKSDREFTLVKGQRGPFQMFTDFGSLSQDYMEHKVLNEFLTNSEDAHSRAIRIYNNLKSLPEQIEWAHLIEDTALLQDFGTGVGDETREEYEKNLFRFAKGFGWGKNAKHGNEQGRYGKGLKKNLIEFCSAYIAISKHKYDIEDEQFTVVVGKTIGKPETATIDCTWKGKSQTPIFQDTEEEKQQEFADFMSEYTPIEHDHLEQLNTMHNHFFPDENDTGVVYLFFGTRRQITKENMIQKFNNLYYERPVDENGQIMDDFHVTLNGERLPLDFYSDKTELLYRKEFKPFESNGYYPCFKRDGTRPRKKQSTKKYLQHEGKEFTIRVDIVKHKKPHFNPNIKYNQRLSTELTTTCGNHVKRLSLKSLVKSETEMHKIIPDVFSMNRFPENVWSKIEHDFPKNSPTFMARDWRMSKLGLEVEMIIRLPPWFYDVIKENFDKNRRSDICMCFTSGIQTLIPSLNLMCHEFSETESFKQTWKKWNVGKDDIKRWEKAESKPPCVEAVITKQKTKLKKMLTQKLGKRKRTSNPPTPRNLTGGSDTPTLPNESDDHGTPPIQPNESDDHDTPPTLPNESDDHDTPPIQPNTESDDRDTPPIQSDGSDTPPIQPNPESDDNSSDNTTPQSDMPVQQMPKKKKQKRTKSFSDYAIDSWQIANINRCPFSGHTFKCVQIAHIVPLTNPRGFKGNWNAKVKQTYCDITEAEYRGLNDYENAIPLPYAVHHYYDCKHRSDKRERIWMDENGCLQNLQYFFGGSDNDVRNFMMAQKKTRLPNGMMTTGRKIWLKVLKKLMDQNIL